MRSINRPHRKMRVAVFVPGGVGAQDSPHRLPALAALLERLSQKLDLQVFLTGRASPPTRMANPLLNIQRLPRVVPIPAATLVGALRAALSEHRRIPFDLFHGFWAVPGGLLAVLLGKLLGRASLVSLQGGETARLPDIGYGNGLPGPLRPLTAWTCRNCTALFTLTHHQAQQVRRSGWRGGSIQVIPFGPEPAFYAAERPSLQAPFRFLQVANLTRVKDPFNLIRAFARICRQVPAYLEVVGSDDLQGGVQALARQLGLGERVRFYGWQPHSRMAEFYHRAQIYLQTSLHEGQGVAVAEGAAAGLLIVGTRTGLIADLAPGAAAAVPPGNPEALAAEVLEWLARPRQADLLRRAAQQWARQHNANYTFQYYLAWYRQLAGVAVHEENTRSAVLPPQESAGKNCLQNYE